MNIFDMPVKFFPADVIAGKAEKLGDRFTAFFIMGDMEFEVMPEHFTPKCFFARAVERT